MTNSFQINNISSAYLCKATPLDDTSSFVLVYQSVGSPSFPFALIIDYTGNVKTPEFQISQIPVASYYFAVASSTASSPNTFMIAYSTSNYPAQIYLIEIGDSTLVHLAKNSLSVALQNNYCLKQI